MFGRAYLNDHLWKVYNKLSIKDRKWVRKLMDKVGVSPAPDGCVAFGIYKERQRVLRILKNVELPRLQGLEISDLVHQIEKGHG